MFDPVQRHWLNGLRRPKDRYIRCSKFSMKTDDGKLLSRRSKPNPRVFRQMKNREQRQEVAYLLKEAAVGLWVLRHPPFAHTPVDPSGLCIGIENNIVSKRDKIAVVVFQCCFWHSPRVHGFDAHNTLGHVCSLKMKHYVSALRTNVPLPSALSSTGSFS